MKKLKLLLILVIILAAGVAIGTRWSDYADQTAGNVADTDTFLIRDVSDTTLAATGTQKEYPWSVLKADLTTWLNATSYASLTGDWVTTGYMEGGVRTVETTTDVNITVSGSSALYINNHASTIEYTLPADPETDGGDSKTFCFRNRQTSAITVTPAAGDVIELAGTDAAAAESIVSEGAKGEFICVQGFDDGGTDRWVSWGYSGTWAEATPP